MKILFLTGIPGALASVIRDTFIEAGWKVAGFGRREADPYDNSSYSYFRMDAISETSVHEAFSLATERVGRPDAVIATVGGVSRWKSIAETTVEEFRYLIDLNLTTFFLTSREGMNHLNDGGRIVSIGAESALHPTSNKGGYIAAKAGVMALTKVLAKEGRTRRITANSIVPTIIRTVANEEWGSPEEIVKWTPPEDIARMCLLLCSENGSSVNGSLIEMPGGL